MQGPALCSHAGLPSLLPIPAVPGPAENDLEKALFLHQGRWRGQLRIPSSVSAAAPAQTSGQQQHSQLDQFAAPVHRAAPEAAAVTPRRDS